MVGWPWAERLRRISDQSLPEAEAEAGAAGWHWGAKTFINNLLKNGEWANFSLRCDEAMELRDRALVSQAATAEASGQAPTSAAASINALERTEAEQRQAAIGLARFKLSQGDIARAREIADMRRIAYADIGLTADGEKLDDGVAQMLRLEKERAIA